MLDGRVVVIRVRRLEIVGPADHDEAWRKIGRGAGRGIQRALQGHGSRRVDLQERGKRRRQHAVLEEVALPGERVVEQSPRRAHRRSAVAVDVPHGAEPRREIVLVGCVGAAGYAWIAGIDEPGRRVRELHRLLTRMERVQRIVDVDERRRHLVPHAVIQRQPRRRPELVLCEQRVARRVAVLRLVLCRSTELERQAEQKIGGGVSRVVS